MLGEADDGQVVRLFHHRVVDGKVGQAVPGFGGKPQEAEVLPGLGQCRLDGFQELGRMSAEGLDHGARGEQEDARVPQEAPRVQHRMGRVGVGLFHEAAQRGGSVAWVPVQLQIAIAGLGAGRLDPEGDDPALPRKGKALVHGPAEGFGVGNHMVGRSDQQQRVGVDFRLMQGRGQNRGCGVATRGFDQDGGGGDPDLGQLLGHDEAEIGVGQHQRLGVARPGQALGRGLEQRAVPH